MGHQRRNSGSCHGVQVVWWELSGTGWKKGSQHPPGSGSFISPGHARKAQSCATINRGCSGGWLPPTLMPHLQQGLDFQLHCQIRIQTGTAVLAQATGTDQHTSPSPLGTGCCGCQQSCRWQRACAAQCSGRGHKPSQCGTINLCGERAPVGWSACTGVTFLTATSWFLPS